mmetsp:Transcript_153839/g.491727  ORF Transcript_153839/g.491727 Transcript_153839/m.491727 type:complete len:213 (-) Transcript_153839:2181-2819(-)
MHSPLPGDPHLMVSLCSTPHTTSENRIQRWHRCCRAQELRARTHKGRAKHLHFRSESPPPTDSVPLLQGCLTPHAYSAHRIPPRCCFGQGARPPQHSIQGRAPQARTPEKQASSCWPDADSSPCAAPSSPQSRRGGRTGKRYRQSNRRCGRQRKVCKCLLHGRGNHSSSAMRGPTVASKEARPPWESVVVPVEAVPKEVRSLMRCRRGHCGC